MDTEQPLSLIGDALFEDVAGDLLRERSRCAPAQVAGAAAYEADVLVAGGLTRRDLVRDPA